MHLNLAACAILQAHTARQLSSRLRGELHTEVNSVPVPVAYATLLCVPAAGHVASGGGNAGLTQQRSSLKLSRAASSNLSTSDEPQPLLSRSAESLHGASAAVRRAKQEVCSVRGESTAAS